VNERCIKCHCTSGFNSSNLTSVSARLALTESVGRRCSRRRDLEARCLVNSRNLSVRDRGRSHRFELVRVVASGSTSEV
jgi:hypothetical protein